MFLYSTAIMKTIISCSKCGRYCRARRHRHIAVEARFPAGNIRAVTIPEDVLPESSRRAVSKALMRSLMTQKWLVVVDELDVVLSMEAVLSIIPNE